MKKPKLKDCAPSGTGVHSWLFYAACTCVDADMDLGEAEEYIGSLMSRPPAPISEVRDALEAASGERSVSERWPARNFKLIQTAFKEPMPPWKPLDITTEEALDVLFTGDPFLCVGKTSSIFSTRLKSSWKGISFHSLIVPSPMTGLQGRTNAGHLSAHSLANTGPRRFLVVEFDWGTTDNQLRLHQHLAHFAPLTAIVSSGGKSMHAWYYCGGRTEEKLLKFMRFAVSLGADYRTWLKSQFVRLPGGLRENGARQSILFLDPGTVKQ